MKLNQLTIRQAIKGIKNKKFSGGEVFMACLAEIEAKNKDLNAYLTVMSKKADRSQNKPFYGIPLAIKDNVCMKGVRMTAASLVLDDFKPPYDATVIDKLQQAGFSFLGKTNMDAWAHGSSTETSDYGPTRNPRNLDYAPGGSSGGSAAAVAADLCLAALGTETGGSIRQPAAWCGCVGFRPSYGRISRYGVAAMASSTDTPGFLTKTVADVALITPYICGVDLLDATSSPEPFPNLINKMKKDLKGKKIGFLYLDIEGMEQTRVYYEQVWRDLEKLGAKVEKVEARDPREAIGVYTVVQRSEVSSNLSRFDGNRYGQGREKFGVEAKRRIMLGTFLLSQGYADKYYWQAQKVRTLFKQDFEKLFAQYDVLISPVSPTFAKKLGCSTDSAMFGELEDIFVEPSAVCGLPSASVPCYHDDSTNLYLGLNIMAPIHQEERVIEVASAYEAQTKWNHWAKAEREDNEI